MSRRLEIPSIRDSIKVSFETLCDFEFQKGWYSNTAKHRFWDSLYYYVYEYLSDNLKDDADDMIGHSLYNEKEHKAVIDCFEFFDAAFEADMPDDYYVNHPQWPKLIEDAKSIVKMMDDNNKKFDLDADFKDFEKTGLAGFVRKEGEE